MNLRYGDAEEERKGLIVRTRIELLNGVEIDQMVDFDTFAAQVAAMDLVVTISNTTAHILGALGVPTFLILGTIPIWYWMLDREDSPWYPSLRLFRQRNRGEWGDVVEQVGEALGQVQTALNGD